MAEIMKGCKAVQLKVRPYADGKTFCASAGGMYLDVMGNVSGSSIYSVRFCTEQEAYDAVQRYYVSIGYVTTLKKSDLEDGMYVKLRGYKELAKVVLNATTNKGRLVYNDGVNISLSKYSDDLVLDSICKEYTIEAVYAPHSKPLCSVKEMTMADIEALVGGKVRIIRDGRC